MKSINERIQFIISDRFRNDLKAFAKEVNVGYTTVYDIVSGRQSLPSCKTIQAIGSNEKLSIDLNWLISGLGEMYKPTKIFSDNITLCYADNPTCNCKVIGHVSIENVNALHFFKFYGTSYLEEIKTGDMIGVNNIVNIDKIDFNKAHFISIQDNDTITRFLPINTKSDTLYSISLSAHSIEIPINQISGIYQIDYWIKSL
ncbi:hypothetical protein [Dysgonomonas sp. ZJ279]|uniref:hypothetical protein n=1 Tax=Dysgonomonas sp. ZJ279 TaxID=2709796 RepID=UPI0013EDB7E1|nr:hypothetical protein [Dysgonomonas sp. ZJ279]